jgi:type III restriction enzyme
LADAVIENPILNPPFSEPGRHFRFGDEGITSEVVEARRVSSYFMPIPAAKKSSQLVFDTEWTRDRIEENQFINRVRERVSLWRQGGWQGVTPTTRRLLEYWTDSQRERPLFFCQVEALETAIYLGEVANKLGDSWIPNELKRFAEDANPGLFRVAFKMATGSGKTVVMAMLIAWQALNKFQSPQDARFSDAFLVVTPGITIRDRLRVLLPSDPGNYYRERDLVTPDQLELLGEARIVITNFHSFQLRDQSDASKTTKAILGRGEGNPFLETPDKMVRRVCRALRNKRGIIVFNDEAHHCYRHRVSETDAQTRLTGDDRKEAERREEEARVWTRGLAAVQEKIGVKIVYDLSATPFFLSGSGYPEGTLFPWVVSDFSLIDAIESGIVKVPRVPVSDNAMDGPQPTYRDLWVRIRDELPKKNRKDSALGDEPRLPAELQGALHSLYGDYERSFKRWTEAGSGTPPVFIVVCNNTSVSKLVFDYIAGWEKQLESGDSVIVPGQLPLFSNETDGRWLARPSTILVDSAQLESGESMSNDFKQIARIEIEEFKAEYRLRYPGRDPDDLTDEDLLREVMNTVGKPGKLGEGIRCVVSVSMLTEGWDANTVTHILGVRAFGTQLLCEQVVGRGLRRISYVTNDEGLFEPEYAEVYGVPFSFIPSAGATNDPKPGPQMTRVRALEDRIALEITFPRIVGYRYELSSERLHAVFDEDSKLALSTQDVPTQTDLAPIVGAPGVHTLDDLRTRREQEVAFFLARRVLERYFADRSWLFPQLAVISRRWIDECVTLKDNAFKQMLLLHQRADDASDRIYRAIVRADPGEKTLVAVPAAYDAIGSTRYVDFDTAKPTMTTDAGRCHISHVVCDTESWEQKMAQVLEGMSEVHSYAKNQSLGFTIPYAIDGEERRYVPDFIVRVDDGHGEDDLLNLIVEVSGAARRDKAAKVATARTLWVPGVNNAGEYGRWEFVEITDPWDAENTIRALLQADARVPA